MGRPTAAKGLAQPDTGRHENGAVGPIRPRPYDRLGSPYSARRRGQPTAVRGGRYQGPVGDVSSGGKCRVRRERRTTHGG